MSRAEWRADAGWLFALLKTMSVPAIAKGAMSLHNGLYSRLARPPRRLPAPAEYCYSIWLKHLILAREGGMAGVPETVAELGPGTSVGVGIAALLSGVRRYVGLDVVKQTDLTQNVALLEELRVLFERRAPPRNGWPALPLDPGRFPSDILDDERLATAAAPARVDAIRRALLGQDPGRHDVSLAYVAPWFDPEVIEPNSVDLLLSHAVLEYVHDLTGTLAKARRWLRSGGLTSHQIDLAEHRLSRRWYGNWVYPDWLWRIVAGGRPIVLNRQPASAYIRAVEAAGLTLSLVLRKHAQTSPRPRELAPAWRRLDDADRTCRELFLVARAQASPPGRAGASSTTE